MGYFTWGQQCDDELGDSSVTLCINAAYEEYACIQWQPCRAYEDSIMAPWCRDGDGDGLEMGRGRGRLHDNILRLR